MSLPPELLFGRLQQIEDRAGLVALLADKLNKLRGFAAVGLTDAQGLVTVDFPDARFDAPPVVVVTAVFDPANPTLVPIALVRSTTQSRAVVRVAVLTAPAGGVAAAGAGITVHLYARAADQPGGGV